MVKRVRVYIEGGGRGKISDNDFRSSWKKFLIELHDLARSHGYDSLEIVRGLGRARTFDSFKNYKAKYPNDLCVLLVDAETTVPDGRPVWDVVAQRAEDRWQRPAWATERHLYLMVPFVETWLVTDQAALQKFFKRRFNPRVLPTTELENRSKDAIEQALERATAGAYRHGQAHEIIKLVDPERVKTLGHGERLFIELGMLIRDEPVR